MQRAWLSSVLISALLLSACQGERGRKDVAVPPATIAEDVGARLAREAEAERVAATETCATTLQPKLAEYRKQMDSKQYWPAASTLRRCSQLLDDPKLRAMVSAAEVKSLARDMLNKASAVSDRLRALEMLSRDYPDEAKRYPKLKPALLAEAATQKRKSDLESHFDRNVSIGDTRQEVMTSGWGLPSHINRTTTAFGTREQWVYGERRYLYFDNGVLTAIQN